MLLSTLSLAKLFGVLLIFYCLHREYALRLVARFLAAASGVLRTVGLRALARIADDAYKSVRDQDPVVAIEREGRRQQAMTSGPMWGGLRTASAGSSRGSSGVYAGASADQLNFEDDLPGLSEDSKRMLRWHRERAAAQRGGHARHSGGNLNDTEQQAAHRALAEQIAARRRRGTEARKRHDAVRQRLREARRAREASGGDI